ncbi:MAG: PadR family transcriptional regulator [Gemmatimonadota bacterium]
MSQHPEGGLSNLEYHVLLATADGPLHGYAIRDAVEEESAGVVAPRAGSLYRVIARLVEAGFLREASSSESEGPHPGRPRRYYALTPAGRTVLADEARRLEDAAALALRRLGARS